MPGHSKDEARRALEAFPRGVFLLTASFANKRCGQLVQSVQTCAEEPMLVCVAARKSLSEAR